MPGWNATNLAAERAALERLDRLRPDMAGTAHTMVNEVADRTTSRGVGRNHPARPTCADVMDALSLTARARAAAEWELDESEFDLIEAARAGGKGWAEIGEALGYSPKIAARYARERHAKLKTRITSYGTLSRERTYTLEPEQADTTGQAAE